MTFRDSTRDTLLDLDGLVLVVDPAGWHWVRFTINPEKPHGLDYSLTLHGPDGERLVDRMTTLRVGIANYDEIKARTLRIARGEQAVDQDEPKVWFTSTESFAKLLSANNRELLRVIDEEAPGSLEELAQLTGRAKSNLSRTLKTMEGYGLVELECGERGRIKPRVMADRVELDMPLTRRSRAKRSRRVG